MNRVREATIHYVPRAALARQTRGRQPYTAAMPRLPFAALLSACTSLTACAVEPGPAAAAAAARTLEWRVLVKLHEPNTDTRQIARRASEISGTTVRYVAATSPQWHALGLSCADDNACTAALERLQRATTTYTSVQREQRRQPQSP